METRFYARFYEEVMRPRLTSIITRRTLEEEYLLSTALLELEPGSRILDIACGTGNFTRAFAGAEPDAALLVGADLSWSMLDEARPLLVKHGLEHRIVLTRLDAIDMPIGTATYDRLHCHAALHFMEDIDAALRSFARVLEPGGIMVIGTFLQSGNLFRRLGKRLSSVFSGFRWLDRDDLESRVRRTGFEIEHVSIEGDAVTVRARRVRG